MQRSEWQRFVSPIIRSQHLAPVKTGKLLGAPLAELDQPLFPKDTPAFAEVFGMADEQIILGRTEHLGATRVALAGSAAEKLAIDAPGAMRLSGNHMQPAKLGHATSEFNIGAATGHVSGDGDLPALAGFGDDAGFLSGLRRVQDPMGKLQSSQAAGNFF